MRRPHSRGRQQGAVIVTVALVLLFLLGFMGIALDFGRLFIVKTELQTATDSCALAAAQELDGSASALTRATSAGLTAGNLNNVNLQSPTWDDKGKLQSVLFRDSAYAPTVNPLQARYAECSHQQAGVRLWLLQALGAFIGNTAQYPATGSVAALAVATRGSSQSTCPIPLALKPKAGGTAPNYGFVQGEWVRLLMGQNVAVGGEIGWANLDGSNSASETEAELNGYCGTKVGDTLGTPGVQLSVADAWNYRFGIYKNNGDPSSVLQRPDFTGYAYTANNWPNKNNAFNGPTPAGAHSTAANFITKRGAYASCADTGTALKGANGCEGITKLKLASFQKLAVPGNTTGGHRQYGKNRRIVTVPVINAASTVIDYSCMLMLQPISVPMVDIELEFLGNAALPGSPCTTNGLPGGMAGPLVPVLVR